jgi:hypothetical protein
MVRFLLPMSLSTLLQTPRLLVDPSDDRTDQKREAALVRSPRSEVEGDGVLDTGGESSSSAARDGPAET